jgi:hypothetical protein
MAELEGNKSEEQALFTRAQADVAYRLDACEEKRGSGWKGRACEKGADVDDGDNTEHEEAREAPLAALASVCFPLFLSLPWCCVSDRRSRPT